ncbi:MAG: NUDIX domain-containing protein [Nitrososphaerota archaeon]|uniref:bis(5'-nucleosyl)-tetraphosphatase n=1 Tax=Candidatus Bathycorpusculum sp. TaxID=2994959 RepID=UPI002835A3C4|nr:NUDIX domain-containing protein [Candidatus Termiticorpusculum sp.]MCL2257777.1 NUDIX domain-containing protein [Candidatus Termiticorpusculum sp.]MCL2292081.1 NUDIX domain-containing protein [Candidatus Termiticorpusculum sp.]MDR0460318.1 NUDIX domain-containing protein [Nitrososphaerota archaeon]
MLDEKSCGAIVYLNRFSERLYLLLHYEAGYWDFVKGNVEVNETEKETVVRELREETGITDACFVNAFREKIAYYYRRHGKTVHKEVIFYLMKTNTETVTISFEHVGSIWLNYVQAIKKLTFKNAKLLLEQAHVFLNKK